LKKRLADHTACHENRVTKKHKRRGFGKPVFSQRIFFARWILLCKFHDLTPFTKHARSDPKPTDILTSRANAPMQCGMRLDQS
jgi:hypothetical protein